MRDERERERLDVMLWDEELKQLKRQVIETFGEAAMEAAQQRVLTVMKWPDLRRETELSRVREALRTEYRRLLQPH